jgi:hypothetical protein
MLTPTGPDYVLSSREFSQELVNTEAIPHYLAVNAPHFGAKILIVLFCRAHPYLSFRCFGPRRRHPPIFSASQG